MSSTWTFCRSKNEKAMTGSCDIISQVEFFVFCLQHQNPLPLENANIFEKRRTKFRAKSQQHKVLPSRILQQVLTFPFVLQLHAVDDFSVSLTKVQTSRKVKLKDRRFRFRIGKMKLHPKPWDKKKPPKDQNHPCRMTLLWGQDFQDTWNWKRVTAHTYKQIGKFTVVGTSPFCSSKLPWLELVEVCRPGNRIKWQDYANRESFPRS